MNPNNPASMDPNTATLVGGLGGGAIGILGGVVGYWLAAKREDRGTAEKRKALATALCTEANRLLALLSDWHPFPISAVDLLSSPVHTLAYTHVMLVPGKIVASVLTVTATLENLRILARTGNTQALPKVFAAQISVLQELLKKEVDILLEEGADMKDAISTLQYLTAGLPN